MAEYKGIKGFKVQYLSADPSDPNIGQTWYNDTSKDLKYTEFAAAAWASGGNLNKARSRLGAVGTQTEALAFGGGNPPATALNNTEEYNGSTWSNANTLGTASLYFRRSRHTNSRFSFGGNGGAPTYPNFNNTEEYDGLLGQQVELWYSKKWSSRLQELKLQL
jgi:hypothetical protein